MLGNLFPGARVRAVAKVIDETINAAFHLHEVTGSSPHKFFVTHPMKTNHNTIDQRADGTTHEFYLAGPGNLDLHIMAHDGKSHFVILMPQGDFLGATIQATSKGRYIVRLDPPLSRQIGKHAQLLLDEFVKSYDAFDSGRPFA
jgi:hypothetical protein